MGLFKNIFVWWDDATWGTRLFTAQRGEKIGTDTDGNAYYRERNGSRRWVIYKGDAEASRVPPEWHAWLHYTVDTPPSERPPVVKTWEKPHVANQTGGAGAYAPPGSLDAGGKRAPATGDYQAWRPDEA
ncbi:MAG: NADH:ubiquinone oxidoreductase subunit NDUFA12 [Sphingomonadales bacterium]|nr:MAG: NADH:ubiquinone oxidoreductase subunit NDUFA12 [Sphingomonadales bacterium]